MRTRTIAVDGPDRRYRLGVTEWGDPQAPRTVVCVHGLTRNGRDFDPLAAALAEDARVICPDVIGRGSSERLDDPAHYALPTYAGHLLQLLRADGLAAVSWVGTSMGGMIGMAIAALEDSPITKLVLNDVGPFIPKAAIARIRDYVGREQRFADQAALEAHLRTVHAPFGPLTDAQWRHLATHSGRAHPEGGLAFHYDPGIALPMREAPVEDVDLWELWDRIRCPVLVIRGQESDLLLPETAREMTRRGPPTELVELDGIGHAPALMAADQIELIRTWLARPSPSDDPR
jgi:pimeloyl-ACP methyl ester carboxylesterase